VRKVGATSEDAVDVRNHLRYAPESRRPASNRGKFRQDLYYRLAVNRAEECPRLRECPRPDIPVLADAILRRLSGPDGKQRPCGSPKKRRRLSGTTIFPAILANSRTFWSVPSRLPRQRKFNPMTCSSLRRLGSLVSREPPRQMAAAGIPRPSRKGGDPRGPRGNPLQSNAAAKLLGITFRALRYRMETPGDPVGGARPLRRGRVARRGGAGSLAQLRRAPGGRGQCAC